MNPSPSRRLTFLIASSAIAVLAACGGGGGGPTAPPAGGTGPDGGTATSAARTISGAITYDFVPAKYDVASRSGTLSFAQASQKPVRGCTVAVVEGSNVLAETSTDDSGRYTLTFTPIGSGSLSVVAAAQSTSPPIEVRDNTDQGALWAIGAALEPSTTTKDLHATHGWTGSSYDPSARTAAPFAIFDSMTTASKALLAARALTLPPLVVNWSPDNVPQSGDKTIGQIGTSHYSPQENQIYVLGKEGVDTDEFDNHVIVHEWGHFIEANLSRSDSPGGRHGPGDLLDPRIAFGEGYGNAMSGIALNDPLYVDTLWGGPGGSLSAGGFDLEHEPSPTDDVVKGPLSETTVARLLYDLFDSGSTEAFDRVALGMGPILDVLVGPEKTTDSLTTIASFIAGLKAQPGVNAADVDTLLDYYNIGHITTQWGDGDPLMRQMYVDVPTSLPASGAFSLGAGEPPNSWAQNQYFVLTGNGSQVTVSATSSDDVALTLYERGTVLGQVDQFLSGTEHLSQVTQVGHKYVVVLTGFGEGTGDYQVTMSFTSP
jgi:hypothetical protein